MPSLSFFFFFQALVEALQTKCAAFPFGFSPELCAETTHYIVSPRNPSFMAYAKQTQANPNILLLREDWILQCINVKGWADETPFKVQVPFVGEPEEPVV
jgi:hypothetical protein